MTLIVTIWKPTFAKHTGGTVSHQEIFWGPLTIWSLSAIFAPGRDIYATNWHTGHIGRTFCDRIDRTTSDCRGYLIGYIEMIVCAGRWPTPATTPTKHMSWLTTINLTDKTLYIPVTTTCDGFLFIWGGDRIEYDLPPHWTRLSIQKHPYFVTIYRLQQWDWMIEDICWLQTDKLEFIGLISLHHAEPGHLY